MKFSRLVIQADNQTFSLAFHPRLTVVAGVDAAARRGLAAELIGSLSSTHDGVNLEMTDDDGRRLAVLRPRNAHHRVIDLAEGSDVSEEFVDVNGDLNLLATIGLDATSVAAVGHLDREGLGSFAPPDPMVERLSELDQTELWSCAARVRIAADELDTLTNSGTDATADDVLATEIERSHGEVEKVTAQQKRVRRDATIVGVASLAAAVPVWGASPVMAIPVLGVVLLSVLVTLFVSQRIKAAKKAERKALADVGAGSYLGFMVHRVDGMFEKKDDGRRREALEGDLRTANGRWRQVAGGVSVDWALQHHEEIEASARFRSELKAFERLSATAPTMDGQTAQLLQSLLATLTNMRHMGSKGQSMPVLLDDPFTGIDPATKIALLGMLARVAGSPQVILLTEQEEVSSWARLESVAGTCALVEPTVSTDSEDRQDEAEDVAV